MKATVGVMMILAMLVGATGAMAQPQRPASDKDPTDYCTRNPQDPTCRGK